MIILKTKTMKQNRNTFKQLRKVLLIATFALFSVIAFGQNPPPPPGGGTGSGNDSGNQLGGNAHIGGGLLILLTMGLAYGGKRVYNLRYSKKEELA